MAGGGVQEGLCEQVTWKLKPEGRVSTRDKDTGGEGESGKRGDRDAKPLSWGRVEGSRSRKKGCVVGRE